MAALLNAFQRVWVGRDPDRQNAMILRPHETVYAREPYYLVSADALRDLLARAGENPEEFLREAADRVPNSLGPTSSGAPSAGSLES